MVQQLAFVIIILTSCFTASSILMAYSWFKAVKARREASKTLTECKELIEAVREAHNQQSIALSEFDTRYSQQLESLRARMELSGPSQRPFQGGR